MDIEDKQRTLNQEVAPNRHSEGDSDVTPQRKGGVFNTLYPPGPKPGAGGRIKNHCRRFWWCDVLVFAIIVLIIVLPIIYVAIPNIAQDNINKSTLEVTSQEITNPTAEGLHLKLVSVARSSSKFHPKIDAFRASLSLEGQDPFTYINIPDAKVQAVTDIVVDQDITFASADQFVEYNKAVMSSESFDVYLDGKTTLHQSGLSGIDVDYRKKVTMKGLNKLQGLSIYDLKILSGEDEILPDGSNMIGTVTIPNPSVMLLELGNVTMNLAVDGESIGYALMPDLTLRPGNNTVSMRSHVQQVRVISLITSKYKDGVLPLEITGNSSVRNGEHLPYFEEAIKNNVIHLDLDAGPALTGIGINITALGAN